MTADGIHRLGGGVLPRRNWTPIGAIELVTMDTQHAYVGDHSPAIALDSGEVVPLVRLTNL